MMIWLLLLSGLRVSVGKKVDLATSKFDSPLADIQWVQPNHGVVLATTVGGRLWRSANRGRNFVDITDMLRTEAGRGNNTRDMKIINVNIHPENKNYVFVSASTGIHFVSTNAGSTWNLFAAAFELHSYVWHPTIPNQALFSRWTPSCRGKRISATDFCRHELYATQDGGKSYKIVASGVVQYNWSAASGDSSMIYLTKHSQIQAHQTRHGGWQESVSFYSTSDFGNKLDLLITGGNKFLVTRNFVFVAKLEDFGTQSVSLMVSRNFGNDFKRAVLPTQLSEKSYTIIDTSSGTVLIHVNHGLTDTVLQGNVYVSDETGLRYSLSLPNNVRSSSGECEFDAVVGVDGVYIANYMQTDQLDQQMALRSREGDLLPFNDANGDQLQRSKSMKSRSMSSDRYGSRTVISFDKGGSWSHIKAPEKDSLGAAIECADADSCYLNFYGITQYETYAPFYSVPNAVGLIMATGNVGPVLRQKGTPNTYMSRDAGRTWREVHKGSFIYEIGDHGGLVVMARDGEPTDEIVFSWNEGISWYDFKLKNGPISVDNVVIEPGATGLQFLVYGVQEGRGVVMLLDFQTLDLPTCQGVTRADATDSDYMTWRTGGGDNVCLLGREITYIRRKAERECFNGRDFKPVVSKTQCVCGRNDYQCEVGFYRAIGQNNECEPSPFEDREYMAVEGCTSSGLYHTHAYRKVVGDECVGGWLPEKVPVPCPPGSPMASSALASLSLVALILTLVGAVAYASRHPRLKQYIHQTGIDNFVEVGYNMVGRTDVIFNFWTNRPEPTEEIEL